MSQCRIIFINRFYWPDAPATAQLLTDLAEGLAATKIPVTVLATGSAEMPATETQRGVAIVRLSRRHASHASLWRRLHDFEKFRRAVRDWLEANLGADDRVICLTDPPLLSPTVAKIVRRKRAHLIHWVQDIFPEIAANVFGIPLLNLLRGSRDRAWREAELCVTPGEAMRELVISRGAASSRVVVSPNWAPSGLAPASSDDVNAWKRHHGLEEKFIVLYSGNLGRAHDFSWCAPLAERFRDDPRIAFVFAGMGPRLAELQKAVADAALTNVHYLAAVPRKDLAALLSAGDVHIVSIRPGCENLVFPSKLAGIAAVGRPVLVVGPANNEPAQLVASGDWGRGFAPSEINRIAETLRAWRDSPGEIARLSAHALAASEHSRFDLALSAWQHILSDDGGSSRPVKRFPAAS